MKDARERERKMTKDERDEFIRLMMIDDPQLEEKDITLEMIDEFADIRWFEDMEREREL